METREYIAQIYAEEQLEEYTQQILQIIEKEQKMIHPSKEAIMTSITTGRAILCIEDNVVIGFCRLLPALTYTQIREQDLPESLPEIYELGTVIVRSDKRRQRIGDNLVKGLHERFLEDILAKRLLIIGTSTTFVMLHTLNDEIIREYGIGYTYSGTGKFPWIESTTCICNPNEPLHGSGVHLTQECDNRIVQIENIPVGQSSEANMTHGKCIMFVSDSELAKIVNDVVANKKGQDYSKRQAFAIKLQES